MRLITRTAETAFALAEAAITSLIIWTAYSIDGLKARRARRRGGRGV